MTKMMVLKVFLWFLVLVLASSIIVYAQTSGDYRSAATGNWSDISTWQVYDGATWNAASVVPPTSSITVTIQSGTTVTMDVTVTTSAALVVATGGTLTTSGGVGINLNGTSNTVNGSFTIATGSSVNVPSLIISSGNLTLTNGSIYPTSIIFDGTSTISIASGTTFYPTTMLVNSGTTTLSSPALSGIINGEVDVANNAGGDPAAILSIASGNTFTFNSDIKVRPTGIINGPGTMAYSGINQTTGFINNGTVNVDVLFQQTGSGSPKISTTTGNTSIWNNVEINDADGVNTVVVYGTPDITINGTLTLTSGTFNLGSFPLILGNSAKIVRSGGSLSNAPTFGSSIDVTYTGTSAVTTSYELPSSASVLNNLAIDNSAGVTLTGNQTVNGTLAIISGTLADGGYTLTVKGNISNAGTHNGSGSITLANGSAVHTLSGSGLYGNIILNDANGATLTGSPTISGVLTLSNGTITTGANTLAIASSGSVSRTSGHIVGNLQKNIATGTTITRIFEIGDATNYTPVSVTFASVSTAGTLTVATTAGEFANISGSGIDVSKDVNRSWKITNNGTVFTAYDAVFNFVGSDVDAGAVTSNFIVRKYDSSIWTEVTTGTKTATSTQATGLTAFSDFVVGEKQPATPTQIAVNAGNGQIGTVGTAVTILPSVIVKDAGNNPVSGVSVTFAVGTGGGSATGLSTTTDASGIATVGSWTLGTTAGSNSLTATSGSLTGSPVTFTATGTAGAADAAISTLTPTSASITANGTSTQVLTVTAKDAYGNLLGHNGLTVAITKESGTGTIGSVTDNSDGTYSATVTSPTASGTGIFVALIGTDSVKNGGSFATQSIMTYSSGAASKLAFVQQPIGVTIGAAISPDVTVQLKDVNNNSVATPGVYIKIALTYGTGVLAGTDSAQTDANGLATIVGLSIDSSGRKVLTASSAGLTSVASDTFSIRPLRLSVKVFLQGPFNTGTNLMNTTLKSGGYLTSHFGSIPIPASAVDSINVEVRDSASAAQASVRRYAAAWLMSDGTMRSFSDTTKTYAELDAPIGSYYVVIRHRNHLAVMSAAKTVFITDSAGYDFTTGQTQAYGTNSTTLLSSGVYGMYAGDVDGDGILKYNLSGNDRQIILSQIGGTNINTTVTGYNNADINMDGFVKYNLEGNDRVIIFQNIGGTNINATISTQVPN